MDSLSTAILIILISLPLDAKVNLRYLRQAGSFSTLTCKLLLKDRLTASTFL